MDPADIHYAALMTVGIIAAIFNLLSFFALRGCWTRWINLGAAVIISAILGLAIAVNISAGCYPWGPKEVEFHQGMTLCPGQSAKMSIVLPDHLSSPEEDEEIGSSTNRWELKPMSMPIPLSPPPELSPFTSRSAFIPNPRTVWLEPDDATCEVAEFSGDHRRLFCVPNRPSSTIDCSKQWCTRGEAERNKP